MKSVMAMADSTDKQVLVMTDVPAGHRQAAKRVVALTEFTALAERIFHEPGNNRHGNLTPQPAPPPLSGDSCRLRRRLYHKHSCLGHGLGGLGSRGPCVELSCIL